MGHLEHHRSVYLSTSEILFFGTPHLSTDLGKETMIALLERIVTTFRKVDDNLLDNLKRDSEWLQQNQAQYVGISSNFDTLFFYEGLYLVL